MPFDETSPWLRLDPELLEPLTQDQITVRLRRKQPIFYQGDMPSTVYVVKEGRVCITTYSQGGMEQQLYIAERGALFGERSCLLGIPHMTSAVSIVDSIVYAIPLQTFRTRLEQSPQLNQRVLQILCRKNSLLIGRLLSRSSSASLQRIAQVLVDMVQEYGIETDAGVEISIRFSHQDVANLLHTSRVTVSKAFQTFARLNIIHRNQSQILVQNYPRLKEIADGEWLP